MFAMVVDDMTTMGDAIAIVDCCLLAVFYAAAEAEKWSCFAKKVRLTNYYCITFLILFVPKCAG